METSALSFAHPAVLNALWLVPLLAALFWWAERRRRAMIGRIVAPKLRTLLAGSTSTGRRWFRGACVLVALGLLVVVLAGPRLGYDTLEVPHRGRDVIIAMDVSRSMLAPDVAPSRLQRAKLLAEDLVSELGADRIGLVAFTGSAFLQAPLTLDHGAVLTALDELDTQLIPRGGTNIAAAIRAATEAFGKAEGFSRALVIISDGEELDADGLASAKQAAADGIRIFTVGVGSAEGSEIPLGPGEFVRDASGKVVQSRLDSARMAQIAEVTGGFYTPLDENAARLLAADGIGKMAEADITVNASRRPIERYQWPLAVAIGLLMLQAMVGERRRRAAAAAALWITASSSVWAAPAGVEAYNSGDYQKARQLFEERLQTETHVPFLQTDTPALQLNAGAAAYRLKDYPKAAEYFSRATLAEDPAIRSDAEFNFGNTLFRQGEGQQDKEKTKADWKDAIAKYDAALKTRPDYKEAKENKERVEQLLKELEKKQEQEKQKQKNNDQKKDQQKQDQQQKDQQKQDQQQSGGGEKDKQEQKQDGQKQDQPSAGGEKDKQDKQDQGKDQQQQQQGGGEKKDEQKQGDQGQQDQGKQPDEQKEGDQSGQKDARKKQEGAEGEKKDEGQGQGGEEQKDETPKPEEKDGGQPADVRPQPGQPGEKPAPLPEQSGEKKQGEVRGAQPGEGGEQEQPVAMAEAEKEEDGKMSESQARALLRALQGEEEKVNLRERRNFQDVSRDW